METDKKSTEKGPKTESYKEQIQILSEMEGDLSVLQDDVKRKRNEILQGLMRDGRYDLFDINWRKVRREFSARR